MSQFSGTRNRLISKKIIGITIISLLIIVVSPELSVGNTRSGISSTSSITRNSIKIEIIETAPTSMDDPNIRNVSEVWPGLFENAENTICIEAPYFYGYSSGALAYMYGKLQEAARRGVKIHILTNTWDEELNYLSDEANIELLNPGEGNLAIHAKYFVIDNKKTFVGSQNWSRAATESNHEIGLLISNEQITNAYKYVYNSGWMAAGGENLGGRYWETDWIYPAASGPRMPSEARSNLLVIENLINSADEDIRVFVYLISSGSGVDQLVNALKSAAERGVTVRVMTGAWCYPKLWPEKDLSSWMDFSTVLKKLDDVEGIEAQTTYLGEYKSSHQKFIVIDSESTYVSSANWTSRSMYSQREVGVVVNDPTITSALSESFDIYWNGEYSKSVSGRDSGLHISIHVIIAGISIIIGAIVVTWAWRTTKSQKTRKTRKWVRESTYPQFEL